MGKKGIGMSHPTWSQVGMGKIFRGGTQVLALIIPLLRLYLRKITHVKDNTWHNHVWKRRHSLNMIRWEHREQPGGTSTINPVKKQLRSSHRGSVVNEPN